MEKFLKCCSAKTSVGQRRTDWRLFFAQVSIAPAATTVLPDPTSPWTSLLIGLDFFISSWISLITLSCAFVREKGKAL